MELQLVFLLLQQGHGFAEEGQGEREVEAVDGELGELLGQLAGRPSEVLEGYGAEQVDEVVGFLAVHVEVAVD